MADLSLKTRVYNMLTRRRSSDDSNSNVGQPPTPPVHNLPLSHQPVPSSCQSPSNGASGASTKPPSSRNSIDANNSPRIRSLSPSKPKLPTVTLQHATPTSASPSREPTSIFPRRRSFRPPLFRASSRTSYSGKSSEPPIEEETKLPGQHSASAVKLSRPAPHLQESVPQDTVPEPQVRDEAVPEGSAAMTRRKVWVKRSGSSATLVAVQADDLVDDVRDLILRKYANSLGRSFDAPDVTLRIIPRELGEVGLQERTLGPEESIIDTLDRYFPGGQTVHEALIIDIPRSKTPRPSPRPVTGHQVHYVDPRPLEDQDVGYFPPQTTTLNLRPPHVHAATTNDVTRTDSGPVQPLPSPSERRVQGRPAMRRQHTSSPISNAGGAYTRSSTRQGTRQGTGQTPTQSALPTPPANESNGGMLTHGGATASPTNISPRPPPSQKPRRPKKQLNDVHDQSQRPPPLTLGGLDGFLYADAVPPINILIVEDNIINLKLLEMFVKRLKVRWTSVMNGREAVDKWRQGGFHLVLMDIQLPIMSGLDATKEIRRLERINGIGVFARSEGESRAPSPHHDEKPPNSEVESNSDNDKLHGTFKSPVIIVALTASSLQSDRHEALAAGCNDFLTKPVNFPWFERKILEWGCMQALIDFDGWRQWKALNTAVDAKDTQKSKKTKKKELSAEEKAAKEAKMAMIAAKMGRA